MKANIRLWLPGAVQRHKCNKFGYHIGKAFGINFWVNGQDMKSFSGDLFAPSWMVREVMDEDEASLEISFESRKLVWDANMLRDFDAELDYEQQTFLFKFPVLVVKEKMANSYDFELSRLKFDLADEAQAVAVAAVALVAAPPRSASASP